MSDNKPCPFCGFSDTSACIENDAMGRIASVSCNICGATVYGMGVMVDREGTQTTPDDLLASAYRAWNTREEPRS